MRFEFKQLPVPANREEAKRKAQEHKEACKKMAFVQYFTNLKADMEEKRKNLVSGGGGSGGPREDGAREDGGGGGGGRGRVYYTRAVPCNSFTAFEHGVNF